jgi:uncharacterized membrane protein YuzA (DUF378 family)
MDINATCVEVGGMRLINTELIGCCVKNVISKIFGVGKAVVVIIAAVRVGKKLYVDSNAFGSLDKQR